MQNRELAEKSDTLLLVGTQHTLIAELRKCGNIYGTQIPITFPAKPFSKGTQFGVPNCWETLD